MAQAIRRQDWFQVTVEILIVVVGIYLGFQVQNWDQNRAKAKEEQLLLTTLAEEYRFNIQVTEELINYANEKMNTLAEINARSVGQSNNALTLDELLSDLFWYSTSNFRQSATDGFAIGGNFELIINREIRDAVIAFPRELDRLRKFAETEAEYQKNRVTTFLQKNTYTIQILNNSRGHPGTRTVTPPKVPLIDELIMDHSLLLRDREMIGIMADNYGFLIDIATSTPPVKDRFEKTLSLIEAELASID